MANENTIWNLPNILTMTRLALIGVFLWQYLAGHPYVAMGVFILAGTTDVLDGYFARRNNQITNFGKLMDPLADKLMLLTALICLSAGGRVPGWLVVVMAAKELIMVIGGYILLKNGIVVQAIFIGKAATVVFLIAVVATFLHEFTAPLDKYLQWLALALSICSMVWNAAKTAHSILADRAQ